MNGDIREPRNDAGPSGPLGPATRPPPPPFAYRSVPPPAPDGLTGHGPPPHCGPGVASAILAGVVAACAAVVYAGWAPGDPSRGNAAVNDGWEWVLALAGLLAIPVGTLAAIAAVALGVVGFTRGGRRTLYATIGLGVGAAWLLLGVGWLLLQRVGA